MTTIGVTKVREFVEALGLTEEPMGMLYTNEQPAEGVSPKPGTLPAVEDEAAQRPFSDPQDLRNGKTAAYSGPQQFCAHNQ